MTKYCTLLLVMIFCGLAEAIAQEETLDEGGFKKENLFTGGGLSLGFGGNSFQAGLSPVLGYSIAPWVDLAATFNYNYSSFRNFGYGDKLRRSTYGVGAFTRIYPVNFLFIHTQFEHNFINEKIIFSDGNAGEKFKTEANSVLLGAGYATGRYANSGQPFFYFSILFDVLRNKYSPYTNTDGGIIPILRGGVQVPLFQGKNKY